MSYLSSETARRALAYPTVTKARAVMWSAYVRLLDLGWKGVPLNFQIGVYRMILIYMASPSLRSLDYPTQEDALDALQDAATRLTELGEKHGLTDTVPLPAGDVQFVITGMCNRDSVQHWTRTHADDGKLVLLWKMVEEV